MTDLIPISAVTDAARNRNAGPTQGNNELDKDAFLQLLVAQLKYQNPLSPSDPNQFMAQTAQFTMVEKLEQLAADSAAQRALGEAMTATSLLGKEIEWIGSDGERHKGVVTGTGFGSAGATLEVGDERVPLQDVAHARSVPASPTTVTEPTDQTDSTESTEPTDQTETPATEPSQEG